MTEHDAAATSTRRTVRFHEYGAPGDVLHLETVPDQGPGRIRVPVHACGNHACQELARLRVQPRMAFSLTPTC
jgi:NADPH:quinone reductase-like Zn-dependent oxidoreductase